MATKQTLSPLPGTFYRRPAPDKPPYKEVGDSVAIGDVIGLVEVMKTFYEVKAESAGESWPFVLWMITRTYWFGCRFAPFRRPGEIHVFLSVACPLRFACFSCTALDARGTLMASIATSAVIAPRPPFPQSALDRDSPPRLPVPHSALERVSPRLPPFMRTFRSPFRALARAAWLPAPRHVPVGSPSRNPGGTYGGEGCPFIPRQGEGPRRSLERVMGAAGR